MIKTFNKELQGLMDLIAQETEKKLNQAEKDYEAGVRDCENGIYDKWYRYHHPYDGRAYDLGWTRQNKITQNETVKFLEG